MALHATHVRRVTSMRLSLAPVQLEVCQIMYSADAMLDTMGAAYLVLRAKSVIHMQRRLELALQGRQPISLAAAVQATLETAQPALLAPQEPMSVAQVHLNTFNHSVIQVISFLQNNIGIEWNVFIPEPCTQSSLMICLI